MKRVLFLMSVVLATMIGFSSCNSDDQDEAMVLSGEWKGDWGMFYTDEFGHTYTSNKSYLKFVPSSAYSTHGYGYQEDYYDRGPYRFLWYKFTWSINNGVITLRYRDDKGEFSYKIVEYKLSNDYFSGYLDTELYHSSYRFKLIKLSDFYNWTPDRYIVSDYYGYSISGSYSPKYELGAGAKAYNDGLPKIVNHGCRYLEGQE